jgi:hypothetical protein
MRGSRFIRTVIRSTTDCNYPERSIQSGADSVPSGWRIRAWTNYDDRIPFLSLHDLKKWVRDLAGVKAARVRRDDCACQVLYVARGTRLKCSQTCLLRFEAVTGVHCPGNPLIPYHS